MNRGLTWIGGLGLGAGLMYLLDPDRGHARRARLREAAVHNGNEMGRTFGHKWKDARNRAQGIVVETIDRLADMPVPDAVLVDRVRARMGHVTKNAHSIHVTSNGGVVTLEGPFPADQTEALVKGVEAVRGVTRVENRLEKVGIDHPAVACCEAAETMSSLRVPVALGVLSALGCFLVLRKREPHQSAEIPDLDGAGGDHAVKDMVSTQAAEEYPETGEPITAHRFAA